MRKIDLHSHSHFSDGNNSIDEIVRIAIERGIKEIAITDHMDAFGNFLYNRTRPVKSLFEYLKNINRLRMKFKQRITIFIGAEITDDFLKIPYSIKASDSLHENLDFFSLFLIETIFIQEPILTALNMKKYLNHSGFSHIPVILAHPPYSTMNYKTLRFMLNHNIGFELNEDKLTKRDEAHFLEFIHSLTPKEKTKLKLSIGSDSHHGEMVGLVEYSSDVIEKNNLWKFVIKPPKLHNHLVN